MLTWALTNCSKEGGRMECLTSTVWTASSPPQSQGMYSKITNGLEENVREKIAPCRSPLS